jgi:hypothetical protein
MGLVRLDNGEAGSTKTQFRVDIIAVHGLNGHYERTWMSKSNNVLWLRDLLPKEMPGSRIYSFDYDSRIFTDNVMDLDDYALKLLTGIQGVRYSEEVSRSLFWFEIDIDNAYRTRIVISFSYVIALED